MTSTVTERWAAKRQTPYQFFKAQAGYSYDPKTETAIEGQRKTARALAQAEARAKRLNYSYEWSIDEFSSSADWIDDNEDGGRNGNPWQVWACVLRNEAGVILQSLCGIDFGRDGEPWGQPYKRVVEAELALEAGE